jgi:hypothetical protein
MTDNAANDRPDDQGTSKAASDGDQEKTNAGAEAMTGASRPPKGDELPTSGRDRQHVSGYGGDAGDPKPSSDAREPNRPD